MIKKTLSFFILLFITIFSFGCDSRPKNEVYLKLVSVRIISRHERTFEVQDGDIVDYYDDLTLYIQPGWYYNFYKVRHEGELPLLECTSPDVFDVKVYCDGDLVKDYRYSYKEYKKIDYEFKHNFLTSDVTFYKVGRYYHSIDRKGSYVIECYMKYRINGEEKEMKTDFNLIIK